MLSVIILSVIMLSVIMLSVIMLSVILLIVVAPFCDRLRYFQEVNVFLSTQEVQCVIDSSH